MILNLVREESVTVCKGSDMSGVASEADGVAYQKTSVSVTTGEEMARTECMGYGGQQELLTWGGDGKDYRASLPQDRTIYYC